MATHRSDDNKENNVQAEVVTIDAAAVVRKNIEAVDAGIEVQLKSELDRLTITQTLWAFRRTVLICFVAGFSAITDGYQGALTNSVIANKGFIEDIASVHGYSKLQKEWVSTFGGLASTGQVVGQFCNQWFADWFGRRASLWISLTLLLLGVIVESVTTQWWNWTIAKFLAGIGYGSFQAALPVYLNEQSVPQIRGIMVVAYTLWANLGSLLSAIVLYEINNNEPYKWKLAVYSQYAMIGVCALCYIVLPESPWWLVSKGKIAAARKNLAWKLHGVPGVDVDHELGIIAATIEKQRIWERENAQGPFAMLKGLDLKRFLIGSWPKVLQQFIGLSIFSNYQTYFFQLAGNQNPFQVTLITSCLGLIATVCDCSLVDKIGRRRMTLFGFGGALVGVVVIAIVGLLDYQNKALGTLLVVAGVIANFCNTFQSSTSYAYLTELSSLRFRARATGWGLAWCNVWGVLFSFTVPLMLGAWNVRAIWFFVCTGIPGFVVAYLIMPESTRRSAAEIDEMFVDRVPLRKWRGYKTAVERDLDNRMGVAEPL